MIEIMPIVDKFQKTYETEIIESYEDYINSGHTWCWCFVGNIIKQHEYGEEHVIKYGTKHFSHGTKVYLAPAQWGDGYEKIVVIGLARQKKYIEIITRSNYIENFRIQKVFNPAILKIMCNSKWRCWGDTESDKNEIIEYLERRVTEEA